MVMAKDKERGHSGYARALRSLWRKYIQPFSLSLRSSLNLSSSSGNPRAVKLGFLIIRRLLLLGIDFEDFSV
ncbi:hypothetical protein J1614_001474 [Plenodomus biglobosus]|nr:hypothetical protein J1614_001474 [Plenodomus biglobosus]